MQIKQLFFEFYFQDFQLNSSTQNIFKSKSIVPKLSTNGAQSHLKLQVSVKKTSFFNFEF